MNDKSDNKLNAYLGFCAKARKMQAGYNTCLTLLDKKKTKAELVIITEDAAEGTKDKITGKAKPAGVKAVVFGGSEEISHMTGNRTGTVFTITDKHFAEVISQEIDRIRSKGELTNAKESV